MTESVEKEDIDELKLALRSLEQENLKKEQNEEDQFKNELRTILFGKYDEDQLKGLLENKYH